MKYETVTPEIVIYFRLAGSFSIIKPLKLMFSSDRGPAKMFYVNIDFYNQIRKIEMKLDFV